MDRPVPLCLPSHSPPREDSDQDHGGLGGAGHHHHPPLAEEILVPPSPPDGVRDPTLATTQTGCTVTTPIRKGRTLPHRPGNSPVDGVEAEQRSLQDNGFFLRQLSEQSSLPPVTPLERCTIADVRASLAGVTRGVRIH